MKEGLPRCPVPAGGAVRAALEMRRARGPRSPQKGLTEVMRCSAKVVAYFKPTGAGWQAYVEAVLREYLAKHRRSCSPLHVCPLHCWALREHLVQRRHRQRPLEPCRQMS